jgi:threonine/homoserine/homoserine lactone efflux protein
MEHLAGFIAAAAALTGSPGPANLALAAGGAAFGTRRTLPLAAGIVTGVHGVLLLTGSGIVGLLLAVPGIGPVVTIAAAAYMVHLAYRIATAPPLADSAAAEPPGFLAGALLGIGNPKAYAAMAALASGFTLAPGRPALDLAAKALVLLPIVSLVAIAWVVAGRALSRALRQPGPGRIINLALAALLLASVAAALLV